MTDRTWDLLLLVIGAPVTLILSYIVFKQFKRKIKKFNARIDSDDTVTALIKFIHAQTDNEIFSLDISLKDEYANQFKESFGISFPEYNEQKHLVGGVEIIFQREDEKKMHIDMRPSANRIKGHFKIIYSGGPQMGWFTISLKFVELESIYNNL